MGTRTVKNRIRCFFCIGCLIVVSMLASCKGKESKSNQKPYENDLGIKPSSLAQIDTVHFTTIKWINPVVNFGVIKEGDSALLKFRFKNTGVHPLFLSAVRPSCGCSLPRYSEEATWPDEENELAISFYSKGQRGAIHKTISVISNTANGVNHLLTFEGTVENTSQ
jgi:hypothetical protein